MRRYYEFLVESLIYLSGVASIVFVILIFIFLLKEGLMTLKYVGIFDLLFGKFWYPISEPPPLGVACAIFIGEIAPNWLREILKAGVELLAAIPSIVLGFIGLVTLVPLVKKLFHLPTGLTAISGSIMLA